MEMPEAGDYILDDGYWVKDTGKTKQSIEHNKLPPWGD
jgi:hypothetical protein